LQGCIRYRRKDPDNVGDLTVVVVQIIDVKIITISSDRETLPVSVASAAH